MLVISVCVFVPCFPNCHISIYTMYTFPILNGGTQNASLIVKIKMA